MKDLITVHFLHPETDAQLQLQLPRDTVIDTLTGHLYEAGFIEPQKPGYRYLVQNHLCGSKHILANYLPETADEMTVKVFNIPTIMT
jgi:hypothetical protein